METALGVGGAFRLRERPEHTAHRLFLARSIAEEDVPDWDSDPLGEVEPALQRAGHCESALVDAKALDDQGHRARFGALEPTCQRCSVWRPDVLKALARTFTLVGHALPETRAPP